MIRRSNRPLTRASHTPRPIHSDSDVVVLALVTAEALEAKGEIREAAQWLRRAADQVRKDGNEDRVRVLTRAAVDLMKANRLALLPGSSSSSRRTSRSSFRRTTSPRADTRADRTIRPEPPASLRDARAFVAPRSETREPSGGTTMEALLGLMASAG